MEQLESRQMLTVYVVDTLADTNTSEPDGVLSLREAIIAANTNDVFGDAPAGDADGDQILFDESIDGGTIDLFFGQMVITDDLTMGSAETTVTVNGRNLSRIFVVQGDETWGFSNMTLKNANAPTVGGGICFEGNGIVNLNLMIFDGNRAEGNGGGGIYNASGTVNITESVFVGNQANGLTGHGGGVLSDAGSVVATMTDFDGNRARIGGGGISVSSGNLELYDCNLVNNVAGGDYPGTGGGIETSGLGEATVQVVGTTLSENQAQRSGGGIWNHWLSTLTIRGGSVISENAAYGPAETDGGGGVFNGGGLFHLQSSWISDNQAAGALGSGGGIFSWGGTVHVNASNINANVANRAGGGIEVLNAIVNLQDSVLGGGLQGDGNVAGPIFMAAPGNGGGLHVSGGSFAEVTVDNTIVRNNQAAAQGGGLWNHQDTLLVVRNQSDISFNWAHGDANHEGGGGIFNNGGDLDIDDSLIKLNRTKGTAGSGGGLFSRNGLVEITNSVVEENVGIYAGGGIAIVDGQLDLDLTLLTGNRAGMEGVAGPGNGGGVYVGGSAEVNINDSTVSENTAALDGGGIWNGESGTVNIVNQSGIEYNEAQGEGTGNGGGGVFNSGGTVFVQNSSINDNLAGLLPVESFGPELEGRGGGILSWGGEVRIEQAVIQSNLAGRYGGGIALSGGGHVVSESLITENAAGPVVVALLHDEALAGFGGGIYIAGPATTVNIGSSTVSDNRAGSQGGGLWSAETTTVIVESSSAVTGNQALGPANSDGGGGAWSGGLLRVLDSLFAMNEAPGLGGTGGGILSVAGTLEMEGSEMYGNSASRGGGGVAVVGGTAGLIDTAIGDIVNGGNSAGKNGIANPGDGGGLFMDSGANVTIEGGQLTGNSAAFSGGGLYKGPNTQLTMSGGTFVGLNDALFGGGLFDGGGIASVTEIEVSENDAVAGAGIFADDDADLTLVTPNIHSNLASGQGGGIFNRGLLEITVGGTITGNTASNGGGIFTAVGGITDEGTVDNTGNTPNNNNP